MQLEKDHAILRKTLKFRNDQVFQLEELIGKKGERERKREEEGEEEEREEREREEREREEREREEREREERERGEGRGREIN
jgi:hypothetical protein